MQLPQTEEPEKYAGLYVIDFGDQCAMGYTADEVAVLLDSEQYAEAKVYKIHRARPDGTMDLRGVTRARLNLESGMFFHCRSEVSGRRRYQELLDECALQPVPCRTLMQLARSDQGQLVLGLIFPAEYEEEMGRWLADINFNVKGPVEAGISQVGRFYTNGWEILEKHQLWPAQSLQARSQKELLASVGQALQR